MSSVVRGCRPFYLFSVLMLGSLLVLAACVQTSPAAPSAQSYSFDAIDYGFEGPQSIQGGLVTIEMSNEGQEPHHLQLLRLNDDVTFEQFTAALQAEGEAALRFVTLPGGVGALDPGANGQVTLDLEPGNYVMICFIPSPDGVPHLAKGMVTPLVVEAGQASQASAPQVAATIDMQDFSFDQPDSLPAGENVYRVVNNGPQPHEWNLLKLQEGKTMQDVAAFFEGQVQGPPPFNAVGGMNGLSDGTEGYVTLDLEAGNYIAICNIPDAATGQSHAELGMVRPFTVR